MSEQPNKQNLEKQEWPKVGPMLLIALLLGYTVVNVDKNIIALILDSAAVKGVIPQGKIGLITSTFFLSYAVSQLFIGILVDKLGPKIMLIVSLVGAGAAAILLGTSNAIVGLSVARLIAGVMHAGYPSGFSKTVAENYAPEKRAFPQSLTVVTAGLGGIIAIMGGTAIINKSGWESAAFLLGALYIIAAVLIVVFVPGRKKKADLNKDIAQTEVKTQKLSYLKLITNKKVLLLIFPMFFYNFEVYGIGAWNVTYFRDGLGQSDGQRAIMLTIRAITSVIASTILSVVINKKANTIPKAKKVAVASMICAMVFYAPSIFLKNAVVVHIFQTIGSVFNLAAFMIMFSWSQRIIPAKYMGTAFSVINGISVASGFIGPNFFASMIKLGGYKLMWISLLVIKALGAVGLKCLPSEQLDPADISK